jgi:hypothetical protein
MFFDMRDSEIRAIIGVWETLVMLNVSLHRIGIYWAFYGEDAGRVALSQFMGPKTVRRVARARSLLTRVIERHRPELMEHLEQRSEDEERIGYWMGVSGEETHGSST